MRLDYTVSLRDFKQQVFFVRLEISAQRARDVRLKVGVFEHPLFGIENIMISHGRGAEPIDLVEKGFTFTLDPVDPIIITYKVITPFKDCMGSDRECDVVYPFSNDNEVFFGTGLLATLEPLEELETEMIISVDVSNMPLGWREFSSMTTGGTHPVKLDGFFWYACRSPQPLDTAIRAKDGDITFRVLTQKTKNFLPVQIPGYGDQPVDQALLALARRFFNWLELYLAPYTGLRDIDMLILRAPDDFSRLTQGRAFATGENVMNGIVAYAPDDPEHAARYGYKDYGVFLASGLLHEIMHFYTTKSWHGKYKSVLYPSADCPPPVSDLIGEYMNLYIADQHLYWLLDRAGEPPGALLLSRSFRDQIETRASLGKRDPMVDLFLFDYELRLRGSSLVTLFGAMIRTKQAEQPRKPYRSIDWMLTVMNDVLRRDPQLEAIITSPVQPNYARLLPQALISSAQVSDRKRE